MVSGRVAPTVAVGVNRYFHEVRIVEGPGRRFERRIIKMPVWGPCFPEPPAEPAPVPFHRHPSSLLAECGELAGSGRGLLKKTRRSESSQVGRQRPIPRIAKRTNDTVPGADVVGEAMDEDDGFRLRTAAVLVRDFQTTRSDPFRHLAHGPRIAGKPD